MEDTKLNDYFNGDLLAPGVWAGKYKIEGEETPTDMHKRLAKRFNDAELKYAHIPTSGNHELVNKLSEYGKTREQLTEDKIFEFFDKFEYIIPQGSIMSQLGSDSIGSLSNCFVIGQPHDSYGGIFLKDQELVQLMKRRGGVGIDISTLRPAGTHTSNAAKSSTGAISFMHRYSNSTREVSQNGRRGALMLSINVNHPDVLEFAEIKRDLTKVTGANISIMLNNEFMKAVDNDEDYILRFPIDLNIDTSEEIIKDYEYGKLTEVCVLNDDMKQTPGYVKKIKAKELWNEIVKSARDVAEPGLMFIDNHWNYSPDGVYEQFKGITTNPCIVGDTLIATGDGRNAVTIKQLAEEGKDVLVYSTNTETGKVELKMGRNPRMTKRNAEVWKLILDDGSEFIATPDHKILLKNLNYIELKDLKPGMSISPFNSYENNGYRQITNVGAKLKRNHNSGIPYHRNRRQYRLIHEYYHGITDGSKYHIHHIDFNNKNDNIDNLQSLLKEDHIKLHSEKMMGKNNPYHKMSDEWKKKFASHPGESNGRYSGHTNDELIIEGKKIFNEFGKITQKKWIDHAKENNLPQFLGNDFRFGTFSNFKNQVTENHKVVSVEFHGYEDVYNITVDDNHNYNIITSNEDDQYVVSSGICVKNCGEIFMQPYDACRLIAVNLYGFVENPFTDNAFFNLDKFYKINYEAMRLSDNLIDLEVEHINRIIDKIKSDPEPIEVKQAELDLWYKILETALSSRRTGLGFTALGDMLAALNLKYDSDKALQFVSDLMKEKMRSELDCSIDLAVERGTFIGWDKDKEFEIVSNNIIGKNDFYKMLTMSFPKETERMIKYGRRNVSWSTVAPTGSVSILAQTTSGLEPLFAPYYMRRKKVNPGEDVRVDFIDDNGDSWQEFPVLHPKFNIWYNEYVGNNDAVELHNISKEELDNIFKKSPWYGSIADDINWVKRVEMQGIIQQFISHSISSTINLPENVTTSAVDEIYMESWKKGLKGVTVYRDGSRSGVLFTETNTTTNRDEFDYVDAIKRPKELSCDAHVTVINGVKYNIFVGLMDEKPYEMFITEYFTTPKTGLTLKKIKRGRYDVLKNGETLREHITIEMSDEQEAITRLVSTSLRHGANIKFITEQLNKSNGEIFGFTKGLSRVLKKYIPDGTESSVSCDNCGSTNMVYEEGCLSCKDCGDSRCS